jgi:hypothetical protein
MQLGCGTSRLLLPLYEAIPFLHITSSVNVGFPVLLGGELGRELGFV